MFRYTGQFLDLCWSLSTRNHSWLFTYYAICQFCESTSVSFSGFTISFRSRAPLTFNNKSHLRQRISLNTKAIALCSYPHVKVSIRDLSQTFTTAPIFQKSHYFRQKYLEIASWAVSLFDNIWVRVEHSLLQQLNSQIINCSSVSLQAGCDLNCGDEFNTSLKTASNILPNIFR